MADGYDIVIAKEEDKERIADYLRKKFLPESPVNVAVGANPNRRTEEMNGLQLLSKGMSLLAVSRKDQRILGATINFESSPQDESTRSKFRNSLKNESYVKIEDYVRHMEEHGDIWNLTGSNRAFYIYVLSVDPEARGQGIARALMERTRDLARTMGYPMMWIICTNVFSIRIARKMGMHPAYTMAFADYKDKDGKQIMDVPHPNTESVLFVEKLNPQS